MMFHVKHLDVAGSNISVNVLTCGGSGADFVQQNPPHSVMDVSSTHNGWRSQTVQSAVWFCLAASVVGFFVVRGKVL